MVEVTNVAKSFELGLVESSGRLVGEREGGEEQSISLMWTSSQLLDWALTK